MRENNDQLSAGAWWVKKQKCNINSMCDLWWEVNIQKRSFLCYNFRYYFKYEVLLNILVIYDTNDVACLSNSMYFLIHSAGPQSRPVGIIVFAHVRCPSVHTSKSSKTKQ